MAKHPHQVNRGVPLTATGVYGRCIAGISGILETLDYKSPNPIVGDALFDILINGVSVYADPGDRPLIADGGTSVTINLFTSLALEPSITKDDVIEFHVELESGGSIDGLYSQGTIEDGLTPFYGGTSTTSNTIASSGSKTFTTQKGLGYVVGSRVRFADSSNPTTKYMEGVVTSYSGTTITATIDNSAGSGTITSWNLSIAGQKGPTGANGLPGPQGDQGEQGEQGEQGPPGPSGQNGTNGTTTAAGKQTMWIPASAMIPATTNGPSSAQIETGTNKINYPVLDFDGTTAEYAHFSVAMPKSWDKGTVSFQAYCSTTNSGTSGVAFGLQGIASSDGDTIDTAFGTMVSVTDAAQSSAAKQYVTAESGAVTIAGTPANDDLTHFMFSRDPSNGSDNMTEDARLMGVKLFFTTNAENDN